MKLPYEEPEVQVVALTTECFLMESTTTEPFDPDPTPGEWELSSIFDSPIF